MASRGTKRPSQAGPSKSKSKVSKHVNTDPPVKFSDNAHRKHFKTLATSAREVKPTKFVHRESLTTLGILNGVVELFRNIGWERFLENYALTYYSPTLEFIASFSEDYESNAFTAQLFGVPFSMSSSDLNAIMGTPTENVFIDLTSYPHEFNENDFWKQIAGEDEFHSGMSKASNIFHPCLRLAHRILTCTLFGRHETGQCAKVELFFLWCMTRRNGPRPDFASHFFHKVRSVRDDYKGEICIGGLITLIATSPALSHVIESPPYTPLGKPSDSFLNLAALTRMVTIRQHPDGGYKWYHSTEKVVYLILPNPQIDVFAPTNPATWVLVPLPRPDEVVPPIRMQAPGITQQYPPDYFEHMERMYQMTCQMYNWHVDQNHFPPPDPPI